MNYKTLFLAGLSVLSGVLSAYEIGQSRDWTEIGDGKTQTKFHQNGPELSLDIKLPGDGGWTILKKQVPVLSPDDRISFEIQAAADCTLETNVVYADGAVHCLRRSLAGKFGTWEKVTVPLASIPFGWKIARNPKDGAELQLGFSGKGGGSIKLRNFLLTRETGWNEPGDWKTVAAEESEMKLSRSADGLNAELKIKNPGGWALMTRKIEFNSACPVVFSVRSEFTGDLEVKFIEKNGQVHCRKIPVTASPQWLNFVIYPEDCDMKWKTGAQESAELQIGFSKQGRGNAVFKDIHFGSPKLNSSFQRNAAPFGLPALKKLAAKVSATSSADSVRGVHKPEHAVDGKMDTRWNSAPADGQTLLIEFDEPRDLAGMTIFWEEAFTRHYRIYTSTDGKAYSLVLEEPQSDGASDEIFFHRGKVKFLKLECVKRATGWGNSLWEIVFKDASEKPVVTPAAAQVVMDSDPKTSFRGENDALILDLRRMRSLGAIELEWGIDVPKSYQLSFSADGVNFQDPVTVGQTSGGRELHYFAGRDARYLKLAVNGSYVLKEFRIKNSDEAWTPIRYFKAKAAKLPEGAFPLWLYNKQLYWTVIGAEKALEETLVGEDASVEPYNRSFSFAPYIWNGKNLLNARHAKLSQSLEDGYLPIPGVQWKLDGLTLSLQAFTSGDAKNDATYLRYTLKNTSSREIAGKLFWLVRPLQLVPLWQHGGLSPISSLSFQDNLLKVNGKDALAFHGSGYSFGGSDAARGDDVYTDLMQGRLPAAAGELKSEQQMLSGAVGTDYRLAPGGEQTFFVTVPLNAKSKALDQEAGRKAYEKAYAETRALWLDRLNRIQISIPQKELMDVMRANLAYLLINTDASSIHPGSRTYDRSWIRDGAIMSQALLDNGLFNEVREYLRWVASCQYDNGRIPCMLMLNGKMPEWASGWTEWDGNGAYVFAIASYYRFTGDREFIREIFPSVVKTLQFVESLRKQRLADSFKGTVFYGVIPESNSHEGYFPAKHSLWDDFWILKGWKDGQMLASLVGRNDLIPWMEKEEKELRANLLANIEKLSKERRIDFIPGCFEMADFDATSTAIAVWPAFEAKFLPQKQLQTTFDKYYQDTFLPRTKKFDAGYTPYELRTANAYLIMGQKDKTLKMLNYFLGDMRPRAWKHWAEVVYPDYELPSYVGDMPHTWISAIAINVIRNLFVYESNNVDLVFGAGIDPKWLENSFEVKALRLPTYFGKVSMRTVLRGKQAVMRLEGTVKGVRQIYCANPLDRRPLRATVNGKNVPVTENRVEVPGLPAVVEWYF